ncbi:sigma-54 interaction domain-containing protein [Desulfoplanes formicivorans]|uniref:Sigma-54-dependent Fis family transcriptional regulator n=1 Tax=Desulfoplanes formicivorans TaxID=1592317 RepID=A0A194AEP3_9BACT|nr:sigma 54-interacting transcriptional regulator [Desulfoplanes formicivorans]GAU07798.1 sigma-54-dependent Fis family transcriptional regulator [Desulfoplanes formicivorans]
MTTLTHDELLHHCQELKQELSSYREMKTRFKQSEERLTRLFNNLPGMAYSCSLDHKYHPTLDFASQGCIELFGVLPEYFTKQHTNVMETMAFPEDLPSIRKEQNAAIDGHRPYKMLYRVRLGNNDHKWIWDQGECVYDEKGTPTHLEGIMIDISAQKMREFELLQENRQLQASLGDRYKFRNIIGKSQGMRDVFKLIMKAAKSDANVIILGETGTGKDLVAQSIHAERGTPGAYVPVNCGAIPANLMESAFFGHKKGAFSGAVSDCQGYLAAADGGTLFLDEVGEIDLSLQVKLLRALESKLYTPVGGSEPRSSNFRLIAATNRDLNEMVRQGTMRSDFFFRLHVLPIRIPPLRERIEDLPLLITEFMSRYTGEDASTHRLPLKIRAAFDAHSWPGNVRELQNVIERYLTFGDCVFSELTMQDPDKAPDIEEALEVADEGSSLAETMNLVEKHLLLKALEKNHWKKGQTARELGLNMRTMQRKLKKYGL